MVLAEWTLRAKCANDPKIQESLSFVRSGHGFDPFFPSQGNGREQQAGNWAKEYCEDCPVRLACLAESMKTLDLDPKYQYQGIWGGLTKRSRVALRKKQREQILRISARMKEQFQGNEGPIAS